MKLDKLLVLFFCFVLISEITNAKITEELNKPKKKVAFLAIDPKTNESVHYGSADYPLKKIGGEIK